VPKLVPGVLKAPYVGKFFKAISFRKRDGVDAETARVDLNSMMKEKWVKYHSVSTRRLLVKWVAICSYDRYLELKPDLFV